MQRLTIQSQLFSVGVVRALAQGFPELHNLELTDSSAGMDPDAHWLARSLAAMQCPVAGGAAAAASLQRLALHVSLGSLPPSLGNVLAAMPQLSSLTLTGVSVDGPGCKAAAQLSRLTQLRSLDMGLCSEEGFSEVVSALDGLTRVLFWAAPGPHFSILTPAPALRSLTLFDVALNVASFEQLPALERVELCGLYSVDCKPAPTGSWKLPAQLQQIEWNGEFFAGTCYTPVELTSQLRAPAGLKLVLPECDGCARLERLELRRKDLTSDGTRLSTHGEAILSGALRFIITHAVPEVWFRVVVPCEHLGTEPVRGMGP